MVGQNSRRWYYKRGFHRVDNCQWTSGNEQWYWSLGGRRQLKFPFEKKGVYYPGHRKKKGGLDGKWPTSEEINDVHQMSLEGSRPAAMVLSFLITRTPSGSGEVSRVRPTLLLWDLVLLRYIKNQPRFPGRGLLFDIGTKKRYIISHIIYTNFRRLR